MTNPANTRPRLRFLPHIQLYHLMTFFFVIVCGTFLFRHAIWLDEAEAFVAARDSHSLGELFHNIRYDGHPPLWYLLLFTLTRFTNSIFAMQTLQLLLATTSVYLVTRFAPFPNLAKVVYPFGYFPLFEYGVISRDYQLILFFSIIFCVIWQQNPNAYIKLAVILALLSLSHVLGIILAGGFGAMLLLEALSPEGWQSVKRAPLCFVSAILVTLAGVTFSILCVLPPSDEVFGQDWFTVIDLSQLRMVSTFLHEGLLPLLPWKIHFWESRPWDLEYARIGPVLAILGFLMVRRSRPATTFYIIGIVGNFLFFYTKWEGRLRHHGVFFIVLIAACWMAWSTSPSRAETESALAPQRFRLAKMAFTLLLFAQLYSTAAALAVAWRTPFSNGEKANTAFNATRHPTDILMGESEILAPVLAAYNPGIIFEFPATHRISNFPLYREGVFSNYTPIQTAAAVAHQRHQRVIYISREPVPTLPSKTSQIEFLPATNAICGDSYAIYSIDP